MICAELIEKLASSQSKYSQLDAGLSVHKILEGMSETRLNGPQDEVKGFGSLGLNFNPSRIGCHSKSETKGDVTVKHAPFIGAAKELRVWLDASRK